MSKDIKFYELSVMSVEKALPQLIYKIYDKFEKPMILLLENEEQVNTYDNLLWSFSSNKFLPHGIESQDAKYYENLLITNNEKNLNQSDILISNVVANDADFLKDFKQIVFMFLASNKQSFTAQFQELKNSGAKCTYWQQDQAGKWVENA